MMRTVRRPITLVVFVLALILSTQPALSAMVSLQSIVDDFNDGVKDTAKWTYSSLVTESGGLLRIPANTDPRGSYEQVRSVATSDLRGSSATVRVTRVPDGASSEVWLDLAQSTDNSSKVSIIYTGGIIQFRESVQGRTDVTNLTYSATSHAWWRIREAAGVTYWETSPDGSAWTVRKQKPTAAFASDIRVSLRAGQYSSPSVAPGEATFDSFNAGSILPPASTTTVAPTTTVLPTTTVPPSGVNRTLTADVSMPGFTVPAGEVWRFDPNVSTTVSVSANVIVRGTLQMRPANPGVVHTLRFVGINEDNFVGGGMVPLDTDVGLWVMGAGRIDAQGGAKTAWTTAAGSINQGDVTVTLSSPPAGWAVGDEISIAPTEAPTVGAPSYQGFDDRTIKAISGATVTLSGGTDRAHPKVNATWTAEVMNFTRNVRIEGTASGRSHIFINSTNPQTVNDVAIRYMGPRKFQGQSDANGLIKDPILGRYGLHFHLDGASSRGSMVDGTVIRDTGAHGFVLHESDGVTVRNAIAYNLFDSAYWWDTTNETAFGTSDGGSDNVVYDHNIAAKISYDPYYKGGIISGFKLGTGQNNVIRDSVGVGIWGSSSGESNAFDWGKDNNNGTWEFSKGNVAHNNQYDGIRTYQNRETVVVSGFVAYYNGTFGIEHGSYFNSFLYRNSTLYGNGWAAIGLQAVSLAAAEGPRLTFDNMVLDGAGISQYLIVDRDHTDKLPEPAPTLISNSILRGYTESAYNSDYPHAAVEAPDRIDFVNDTFSGNEFFLANSINPGSVIRVQDSVHGSIALRPKGQVGTFRPEWNANVSTIAPFAGPVIFGDGTGLTGTYFDNPDFTNPMVVRTDTEIDVYSDGQVNVAPLPLGPDTYSIRWNGQVQPRFSETYTFALLNDTGARMWVNGQLMVDNMAPHDPVENTGAITLVAGQKYDIRIDYFQTTGTGVVRLAWSSPSQPKERIRASQLFPQVP